MLTFLEAVKSDTRRGFPTFSRQSHLSVFCCFTFAMRCLKSWMFC
jgi:hypothetical protein